MIKQSKMVNQNQNNNKTLKVNKNKLMQVKEMKVNGRIGEMEESFLMKIVIILLQQMGILMLKKVE